ncbi:MAG: hypothetical protein ACP5NW_03005 [Candidatus Woesearchaeota archaeon]
MRRKGQTQLGESTAVIIIVIIILFLGVVFWNKVSNSDIKEIQMQSQELSVIEIANNVPEMSELKCYESGVNKVKCLDWYKVLAMSNATHDNPEVFDQYNNYFKNSRITVTRLYPGIERNITIYDAKLNNNARTLLIPIPVNINDYVEKQTYYGLIIVEGYYNG